MKKNFLVVYAFFISLACNTYAQVGAGGGTTLLGQDRRTIITGVPFLQIAPDARSGAMGDVGAAISPDANASHWNSAKLAFIGNGSDSKNMGFALSYNPWLRKLVNDMSLNYLTGYTKLRKEEAIAFNLLYFDLGSIQFTDANGNPVRDFNPQEFSIGGDYSRKLSEKFGVGVGLKFIHSNLSGGFSNDASTQVKSGNTAAGDIGIYYVNDLVTKTGKNMNLAFGANISNIGGKISYTNNNRKSFIPTNLRVGSALTFDLDEYNKVTLAADLNKLMVPTPPVRDSAGNIIAGKDDNRPFLSGMFGSFTDAPGGFKEELKEIIVSGAVEYWYNNLFAARGGYFHENKTKGNRRYFTLGFGLRYQVFGLDFAYLIPVVQNNPLAETLRFTLQFNFKGKPYNKSVAQ